MAPSILVLANLAEAAEPTARYAAALATPLHARLTLLHLEMYPVMLAPELIAAATEQTERQEAETMADLRALAHRLPVPTEVIEMAGLMGSAVTEAVRHQQPLLLVIGLRTEHNLLDSLLLNQVLPVLRDTHRPLLLVPPQTGTLTLPRRVLVAVDAEPFTPNAAVRELAPLLASWSAAYTVAHVLTNDEPAASSGRLSLADVRASGLLPPGAPLDLYQEAHESPAAGILQALNDTQADLLVLVARPRSFFGDLFHRSVTAAVLRHCPVPVLLLPAAPETSAESVSATAASAAQWTNGLLAGLAPAS